MKQLKDHESQMGEAEFRMPPSRRLEVGQVIKAEIVSVGSSHIFVDVGAKSEAALDIQEVTDDDGQVPFKAGDMIEAYVVQIEPEVVLSTALARRHLSLQVLEDAHDTGVPVEGKVTGVNKGGLEIDLNGSRAFCPLSQIDLGFCEDPSAFIGQRLPFRVTKFSEDGRDLVVSRRALLEEERQEAAAAIEAQLQEGAEFEGEVVSLQAYGAFVDIGGVQGMVHISEITHGHLEHPQEALQVGQKVRVRVMRIEKDRKNPDRLRVALSIRALLGDPWEQTLGSLHEGSEVQGKVVRLQPFGAFVEIAPGVDGLVHVSELSDARVNHPGDVVKVGDAVTATVIKLDPSARRISLSLRGQGSGGGSEELVPGSVVDVVVNKIKPFGLLVAVKGAGRGLRGLIPTEETTEGRGSNLRRSYAEGTELKAMVTAVEPDSGKLRLSIRGLSDSQERADFSQYIDSDGKSAKAEAPRSLGTLGDLLRHSLDKGKKG